MNETIEGEIKAKVHVDDDDAIDVVRLAVYDDERTEMPVCDLVDKSGTFALVELEDDE